MSPRGRPKGSRNSRSKASVVGAVRCAFGQCQQDASGSPLGVQTTDRGVAPVCVRCQGIAKRITGTQLVPHVPSVSASAGGGNDMVKVGGVLRRRRMKTS